MEIKLTIDKIKECIIFYRYVRFAKIKQNENILIYGISRGGTTMLAQAIEKGLNARLIWEPLFRYKKVSFNWINPYSVQKYSDLNLGWTPYLPENLKNREVYSFFKDLFNLKVRNIRFFRYSKGNDFSKAKFTVIKFCFANFAYAYLQKKFQQKSIILLRHPFAIAASSLNFGKNFDWHKSNFSTWKFKVNSPFDDKSLESYNDHIELINSPFTLLVYQIVLQYKFVLENRLPENSVVVFYEECLINPLAVANKIQSCLNLKLNTEFQNQMRKASFSSKAGHTSKNVYTQLAKWQKDVPINEQESGLKIFKAMDFNVYSQELEPMIKL
ncbi:sulfotransferase domain-containing protein [Robertkochia solimangrovi]|uniref:sulfotransferase domain-containing protein n=1 Tax=Robertkochia solimangrovi TaxID=2213046 RepID=UPI00117EF9BF|nr:sulfotransferase domain-containing protein [Robertkochia solimangrovi]TRZ44992.1 hypothetical protein DMZ48_04315 [Robertkochia solimangrovi]